MPDLYPLKFELIREPPQTTGAPLLDAYLSSAGQPAAASGATACWALLDRGDQSSSVANGPLAGTPLHELVRTQPKALVGRRHASDQPFPLCVRIFETQEDTPLLVHPCETACQTGGGELNSKFWHVLEATADATVAVGLAQRVTRLQFMERLHSPDLAQLLAVFPARAGDSFFIPPGRVHALSAGSLIWELQQTPVAAQVVSQWGQGPEPTRDQREHINRCVQFEDRQLGRISREAGRVTHTRKVPLVHLSPAYVVDEIRLVDHLFDRTTGGTFHLLAMIRGDASLETAAGSVQLRSGDVCCLPAALGDYRIQATGEPADLLRAMLRCAV